MHPHFIHRILAHFKSRNTPVQHTVTNSTMLGTFASVSVSLLARCHCLLNTNIKHTLSCFNVIPFLKKLLVLVNVINESDDQSAVVVLPTQLKALVCLIWARPGPDALRRQLNSPTCDGSFASLQALISPTCCIL